jgi:predicted GNAT superfamily acetyltransferase
LGFVICLRENTNYKSINYKFFQNRHNKFLYIDRIAIANKYQFSGIGSILYKKLLSIKVKFNIPICAEVNIDPPNESSINFHRKHGFSKITESTLKEGYSVVYMEVN